MHLARTSNHRVCIATLDAEYLAFPSIYCGQKPVDNSDRDIPVAYSELAKWETRHVSGPVASESPRNQVRALQSGNRHGKLVSRRADVVCTVAKRNP